MNTKTKIITKLEENRGKYVSGQKLSKEIDVSRSCVWKSINLLKEEGYNIKSVHNKGYLLLSNNDILSKEGIGVYIKNNKFKNDIVVYRKVKSTNQLAKENIINKKEKIIIANEQTEGRGRRGRSFYSPANKGIYMSLILNTINKKNNHIMKITSMVAVAVSRVISKMINKDIGIKWVNDLYIENKKVCGILTEGIIDMENKTIENIVVGIGINTKIDGNLPYELKNKVGAICDESEKLNRNQLIAQIINEIYYMWEDEKTSFIEEYKEKSIVIGKNIKVEYKGEIREGLAIDINEKGNLLVKFNEEIEIMDSGEISILVDRE